MVRSFVCLVVCAVLSGCVTNTLSTQNAQVAPIGLSGGNGGVPGRAAPQAPAAPRRVIPLAAARSITVTTATTTGATLMLASPQSLAPDCAPIGTVEAKVVTPPANGTIQIEKGAAFSRYSPGDAHYACNSRRTPATLITYLSNPGYLGQDAAAVQIFFPDGKAPTMVFSIDVR